MIKAGTLCVWQNCEGKFSFLNGSDVTAESGLKYKRVHKDTLGNMQNALGYETDCVIKVWGVKANVFALPHLLREKFPPQDEEDLIKEKELEHG